MRIISGTHRGRKINPPGNLPARATTDFAKTALFNILNNLYDLENVTVLDLFSGTGSISFEFASRGALEVTAVDSDYSSVQFILHTAMSLGFRNIKTMKSDVFRFAGKCDKQYDIIFADPPFAMKGVDLLPGLIFKKKLLKQNGIFILEHSADYDFSANCFFVEKRNYSAVNFSFFKIN